MYATKMEIPLTFPPLYYRMKKTEHMYRITDEVVFVRTKSMERMKEILSFIHQYYREQGYSPSVREIAQHIGISPSNTLAYINEMNARGMLSYNGVRRGIATSASKQERANRIPLLGEIACGSPLFAEGNIECYITLSEVIPFRDGEYFALRAKGDSMINIGIAHGDIVIARKQSTADEGQVVVALVNGEETTLKRFYRDAANRRFRLHPENDDMDDMFYEDVAIQGVIIKVIKDII